MKIFDSDNNLAGQVIIDEMSEITDYLGVEECDTFHTAFCKFTQGKLDEISTDEAKVLAQAILVLLGKKTTISEAVDEQDDKDEQSDGKEQSSADKIEAAKVEKENAELDDATDMLRKQGIIT